MKVYNNMIVYLDTVQKIQMLDALAQGKKIFALVGKARTTLVLINDICVSFLCIGQGAAIITRNAWENYCARVLDGINMLKAHFNTASSTRLSKHVCTRMIQQLAKATRVRWQGETLPIWDSRKELLCEYLARGNVTTAGITAILKYAAL